jgi:superfamily II DNA or RNA helicase
MIANIVDNQWVYLTHITDPEDQLLWVEFSISKPNAYIDPAMRGNWDGIFRKYNRVKKRIARPLLSMLVGICKKHNIPFELVDKRSEWQYQVVDPNDVQSDFLPDIKLEEYQLRAIRKACEVECGIIDMPTGSGKGEIICGICKAIACPTLILADQRVVIDQLKKRLELRDVAGEVGLFYAGKKPDGQLIVVGLIQSLTPPKKPPLVPNRKPEESEKAYTKRLEKYDLYLKAYHTRMKNVKFLHSYVKKAQLLIVDECDKASSESYKALFRYWFKGRRRYGLSATPMDPAKPVEALVIQEHLGSIIVKESRDEVLKLGRIVPIDYKMIAFGLEGSIGDATAYDIAYKEWLVENVKFHNFITNICQKYNETGTLILVDRKDVGFALEKAINSVGIEAHFIYGETNKRKRDEILKKFERREFNVLIGGKIINRGLDLAGGCENLIIAGSGKLQSDLIQKVGRALRKNSQGFSRIFDFLFRCNRYLYNHSKARLKAIVDSGFDSKVVFPGGIIDGREFIEKRRFRVDRKYLSRRV